MGNQMNMKLTRKPLREQDTPALWEALRDGALYPFYLTIACIVGAIKTNWDKILWEGRLVAVASVLSIALFVSLRTRRIVSELEKRAKSSEQPFDG